ncbi:MAG: hypothetical protein ABL994_02230 [Verrucomicrobiales bacterium]
MSYSLHIRREELITLDEWERAVDSVPNVRLDSEDVVADLPSGDVLRIPAKPGDAAIYVPDEDQWFKYFNFRDDGEITFDPTIDWSYGFTEKRIVSDLLRSLEADLYGDEGEKYTLDDLSETT